MDEGDEFKVPSMVPQDLQMIQDIIGQMLPSALPTTPKLPVAVSVAPQQDDIIDSSDNDTDSEKEVEADILTGVDEEKDDGGGLRISGPASSADTDSLSSSSDSEDDELGSSGSTKPQILDADENDEDEGSGPSPEQQLRTKNEVAEPDIVIPAMEEVGQDEKLEKVGEVMSIVGSGVVIVKGVAGSMENRAAERALDSDTLLVFEDRKVLGYIYETFGPTHQPMYQVKFNSQFSLDPEKVQVSREVFHVPSRSNFVFVRQLKALKGSDASNAHDEEPGDEELEFSDDEEERAHKRAAERRREEARTGTASRLSTPTPSQMRDQEMSEELYGSTSTSYDYSYNDMDFGAGPSRPQPIPYDDPYSDQYGLDIPLAPALSASAIPPVMVEDSEGRRDYMPETRRTGSERGTRGRGKREDRGRGRGRDRDRRRGSGGDRGRGRGRGRGGGNGGDDYQGRSWGHRPNPSQSPGNYASAGDEYNPRQSRPLSPTSLAIARATGQYNDGSSYASYQTYSSSAQTQGQDGAWGYMPTQEPYDYNYGYQQGYVQPHINPRFASAFGLDMSYTQPANQQHAYGAEYNVPSPAGLGTEGNGNGGGSGGWTSTGEEWGGHHYRPPGSPPNHHTRHPSSTSSPPLE